MYGVKRIYKLYSALDRTQICQKATRLNKRSCSNASDETSSNYDILTADGVPSYT